MNKIQLGFIFILFSFLSIWTEKRSCMHKKEIQVFNFSTFFFPSFISNKNFNMQTK